MLAEFGDAPGRYRSFKDRKNYAGTSSITRQSGRMRIVAAGYIHNDRLVDALQGQASCAILHDSEVRSYYDQLRACGTKHNAALRQVANRLVGILHGCLNARTRYDRNTAWPIDTPPLLDNQLPGMSWLKLVRTINRYIARSQQSHASLHRATPDVPGS